MASQTAPAYVAYYRVSTAKQGRSGLGLEAQRHAVESFANCTGCILAEYVEVESGKRNNRPQLAAAIEHAKRTGARLVIAKLDRLSRNAGFIFTLKESGVDFVAADMPDANTLTIGIFATLAQHERELISERTRAALAARKARGLSLGTPANLNEAARAKGHQANRTNALEAKANRQAYELATLYRGNGLSFRSIANKLNENGYTTRRGCTWRPGSVQRLLGMLEAAAA